MIVFPAPDEPMNLVQTSGHNRPKESRETEQKSDGDQEPPKTDRPGQDQTGPISPEDPLPRVWPAEPETQ